MHDDRSEAQRRAEKIPASLVVRPNRAGEPVWSAVWRDSGKRRMMRTVGRAWLVQRPPLRNPFVEGSEGREKKDEPQAQESWRAMWEKRPGRMRDGTLDERKAIAAARDLVVERELELLREAQATTDDGPRTFGQLADLWLEERRAEVKDRELKASTYRDYESMLAKAEEPVRKHGNARMAHVAKAFGHRPVDEVTGEDVEAFMRKLRKAGLSHATRRKYKTVMRMLLDFATARGVIEKNPMTMQRQKRRTARETALKVYDLVTVEAVATEAGGMVGEVVRLAALSGLRQGELVALRWRDVNFVGRTITVSKTYVAQLGEDVPKSGKTRTVPLSDQAAIVLDRVSKREHFTRKNDLVFCNEKNEHLDASWLRRRYAKARDVVIAASEDDLPIARFHDLRHTFGTRLAAAGVPLSDVQSLMGHSDIATTMGYIHHVPRHDDAERLTAAFADGTAAEAAEKVTVS